MKTDKYNGWTNYETWNAALWLDNDEGSQGYCWEMAQECYDQAESFECFTREEQAACSLAEHLKVMFEDQAEMAPVSGWMADAINAYLGEVNWYEIAKHYMEDVEQEEEQETA